MGNELFRENVNGAPCPDGQQEVCTNSCLMNKVFLGDDRICPNYCKQFCVSDDLAAKLA